MVEVTPTLHIVLVLIFFLPGIALIAWGIYGKLKHRKARNNEHKQTDALFVGNGRHMFPGSFVDTRTRRVHRRNNLAAYRLAGNGNRGDTGTGSDIAFHPGASIPELEA